MKTNSSLFGLFLLVIGSTAAFGQGFSIELANPQCDETKTYVDAKTGDKWQMCTSHADPKPVVKSKKAKSNMKGTKKEEKGGRKGARLN